MSKGDLVPRYRQVADSTWPLPGDDPEGAGLEYQLRYYPQTLTRGDQLHLASIVAAYRELLTCTEARRRQVVRELKPAVRKYG